MDLPDSLRSNLDNWSEKSQWIILALMAVVALYMLIHIGVNWLTGRDIVDGLFVFKHRRRNKDEPD